MCAERCKSVVTWRGSVACGNPTQPVSGITNTKGWQTESDIFSNVVTVRLHKGADEEAIKAALVGFEYTINGDRYEVSEEKEATAA